ncbi:MAG TPA: hypothetical protein HPP94_00760 [Desulfuromonadales bacterium]|nr:hypothetical protein [Desulfuromonadales bacterium]
MKCPKCGYNSFEYYDLCKKCSNDLSGYKQTYGITPIVLPLLAQEKLATELRSVADVADPDAENLQTTDDMFSFDLPDEPLPAALAPRKDDPFSFDDDLPVVAQKESKSEDDVFADLLESTSQAPAPPPLTAAPKAAAPAPGAFDLDNFSWDEPAEADKSGAAPAADDFDSLFGDTKESTHK